MPRRKRKDSRSPKDPNSIQSGPPSIGASDPNPSAPDPNPRAEAGESSLDPGPVSVEVETHAEPRGSDGMFARFLRRSSDPEGPEPEPEPQDGGGSGKRSGPRHSDSVQVANLVVSLFTMVVAGLRIPDDIRPNEDEIAAFSGFGTSILLRHFPLKSKLSRDALDIIGMFSILASWYGRVGPRIREYRAAAAQAQPQPESKGSQAGPIDSADPLTRQLFGRHNGGQVPNLGAA